MPIAPQPNQSDLVPIAFSPDGQQLAFERSIGTPEQHAVGPYNALWILSLATGTVREVASATWVHRYVDAPAWRDNQHLLYRSFKGDTVEQALEEPKQTTSITDGWIMRLSPDRTMLIVGDHFSFDDLDMHQLTNYRLISLAGGAPSAMRTWQLPWTEFSWAPDGAWLAGYRPVDGGHATVVSGFDTDRRSADI